MAGRFPLFTGLLAAVCGSLWYASGQNEIAAEPERPAAGFAGLPPLDQLLAPIALYPDPLVGLILPAATQPTDLAAAARQARADKIEPNSWDPAVKALAHYPELVRWMADNANWSRQLGAAFADQPEEVMDAIQDLRRRAMAIGTLHSDAHQLVFRDRAAIVILPDETARIFLPQFEPRGIYLALRGSDHSLTWSEPLPAGPWLIYCPIWSQHALWSGDWYAASQRHGGWRAGMASSAGSRFSFGTNLIGRAHEWRLADNAQIRNSNVRWGARGSSVLPDLPHPRSRSTFDGDQPRQP
jgi:hypothetical protein